MPALPEEAGKAWNERQGPVILATVSKDGVPNIIYATCVARYGDDRLVVADNYFSKTRDNLLKGAATGALLFITGAGKAYQVKGKLEYHTQGPIFDDMKKWNSTKHPGHAAAVVCVDEVYSGATKLL